MIPTLPLPCTIAEAREYSAHQLSHAYQDTHLGAAHSWWLMTWAFNHSRAEIISHATQPISALQRAKLLDALKRIIETHEPITYIIGSIPFLGLTIQVQPPILIPRPETEAWCADLIEQWRSVNRVPQRILDIGTGSGCIALALAHAFPASTVVGIDQSAAAIAVAKQNRLLLPLSNATFQQITWMEFATREERFDLIVSNPPYIDPATREILEPSVRDWEDPAALFADNHGYAFIRSILDHAPQLLSVSEIDRPLPRLVIEIGSDQGPDVLQYARATGWRRGTIHHDASHRDRVFTATHHHLHEGDLS